jgi:ketosteroid isomerase-like protein
MRLLALLSALCLACGIGTASAQRASPAADHDALRKLKTDIVTAINTRDLASMDRLLHKPFTATVITQDSFADADKLKAYFNDLFTRNFLRVSRITMEAEADELSQIYTGTFAVARGPTKERYDMADGRSFDIKGRWTGVALKENGAWKILAVHTGTNFLDNPVLTAAEKSTLYFGGGGLGLGALIGLLVGFLVGRRRGRPATA